MTLLSAHIQFLVCPLSSSAMRPYAQFANRVCVLYLPVQGAELLLYPACMAFRRAVFIIRRLPTNFSSLPEPKLTT